MYRGLTAKAIERGIDPTDEAEGYAVVELARHAEFSFDWTADPPRLLIHGMDVSDRLRDRDVSDGVSSVAAMPAVRQVLVQAQQKIGQDHPGLVTEGRDQGSVVFPDAEAKFYLDATPEVRAKRRVEQLKAMGKPVNFDAIRDNILHRDRMDSSRKTGPLICPEDAQRIDTSEMSLDDVVELLEASVKAVQR
jgi:cytidylate kinase